MMVFHLRKPKSDIACEQTPSQQVILDDTHLSMGNDPTITKILSFVSYILV